MSLNQRLLVCVPCYNEARRLPYFLKQIEEFDRGQPHKLIYEFRILDDGSQDSQSSSMKNSVEEFQKKCTSKIKYLRFEKNRGKGAVLRDGFLSGCQEGFDFIGFLDGDGGTHPKELLRLMRIFTERPEVMGVLGSRWRSLGNTVERSAKRHYSGRIFATLLGTLFKIPVYDSQCGAKVFRAQILSAERLNYCYNNNWLFDTQLVLTLFMKSFLLVEQPVEWADQPGSKVSLFSDSFKMFMGLLKFRRHIQENPIP